jgi:hypothetical protein
VDLVSQPDPRSPPVPTFIVKPVQGEDFYVAWSTVVDAPTGWGSREQISRQAWVKATPDRLARADEYGTSMCDPDLPPDRQWFGWHDVGFLVMEVDIPNPGNGSYVIPRSKIRALCERIERREDPTDLLSFTAWEDDE